MKLFKSSIVALTCAGLFACSSTSNIGLTERDGSANISQQQAMARSTIISEVNYQLQFTLTGDTHFNANTTVDFILSNNKEPLTLDLNKANISKFVVNGKAIYPNYNDAYLTINPQLLSTGRNTIEVEYSREHSTNGEGLHRFVDPVDNKVYLYSHFEPAAAQQMFAVFDQPDLKATYKISVTAPKDWHVISTMRETQIDEQANSNVWTFPVTPKLSPYNFSMHAGPYHVWEDNSGKYPMRLFARQSVAEQVTAKDWFTYTKQGLTFFDDYFGIEYPFKKYDQLLVPDFLYGAMENAAAVTFAENRFMYKDTMTAAQKQRLAGVIMHEMAHQWFGDLVTMKWWNGLWLNESFASFMGTLATSEATEFTHAWRTFYAHGKQSAYRQDSLVTTHPIEVPVPTSMNAFDNIDAITYYKGASTLKQLRHLLGEDTFQQGVQQYLEKYSYQNAELDDFIGSLAQASNRDLSQWTQAWLYQAGVNTLEADFRCENGRISQFNLLQTAPSNELPTLREQRVQVALFNVSRYSVHSGPKVAVTYKGEKTAVPELIGKHCPNLVYPNFDDWGYVKVTLDEQSFQTAKEQLSKVNDPLLRSMLWQSMWDSVADGKASLKQFINVALVNAPKEQDYTILGQVIGNLKQAQRYLNSMAPNHQAYAQKVNRALSQMSLRMAMQHHDNPDFQRRWFDSYIAMANSRDALDHLADLLSGHSAIRGLNINQDLRWKIIIQLNRYDYPNSAKLLAREKQADSSDSGQKSAIAAEVSRPQAQIKRQWLHNIEHDTDMPFSKLRVAMNYLYPSEQKLLSAATAEERLANIAETDKKGPVFMRAYNRALIPTACNNANIAAINRVLDTETGLSQMTRRALLEARQKEQGCVKISEMLNQ
ncbi:aminopeptidase N [Shewanella sp. UCD-FRSSP16_17]|uniref:aminopeptidase N n=1 Tax=unclassified Shewanella TaxID=196818 RepID=UPI0007EE972D|nr:aminopeptidase N [Shewanella sp. UCD-FRSSP16_17]MBQ4889613.1 aminopeptidase N [Shewanella sp. MMG014]OBT08363.1 aminopeptidase N [Shewanella sp. UCD-FRSSP16_17]